MAQALTDLLHAWREGAADAEPALNQHIYQTLKSIARQRLGAQAAPTLNPTELVHEAVARLLDSSTDWRSRAHFYALAALQMRSVLVDHARRRGAAKRGGDQVAVTLDPGLPGADDAQAFLDLHDALERLAQHDARTARTIELTYFGGLSASEIAAVQQLSDATVERDLAFGRAWLRRALAG